MGRALRIQSTKLDIDLVLVRFEVGVNLEDLSPKSCIMMEYMKKLEEKVRKLEDGLESIKIDLHNVNAMIHSWDLLTSKEGYALIWWNEISLQCRCLRRASIESWEELKNEMRNSFVPLYHKRNFFVKLQKIY
ncbi:hypothetical protein CR513_12323, partial [Mucuna pruriens]